MNFVSPQFVVFLLVIVGLFIGVPARFRLALLTLGSYLFYASWSLPFIGVILITTNVDYILSHWIANTESQAVKKRWMTVGIVTNLLVLCFFKYYGFLDENVSGVLGWFNIAPPAWLHLEIILPLGISFYTFEAISYLVDVYRGGQPSRNWLEYNFYIMYFPHLISGPIIRFCELAPQYKNMAQLPDKETLQKAFSLIILGYLFKIMVADNASTLADLAFESKIRSHLLLYLGVLAFTVQIYFDFMGYTHIARGASLLFNIELPVNFNHPYSATNISDFWRRWHMSLSRWIRDYLYFPLGGSRTSTVMSIANLLITMTLCGLWHGAGWNFIFWGFYHGMLLGFYHLWKPLRPIVISDNVCQHSLYHGLATLITFISVVIGWVFFRAQTLDDGWHLVKDLFKWADLLASIQQHLAVGDTVIFAQLLMMLVLCFSGPIVVRWLEKTYLPLPYYAKATVAACAIVLCWILTAGNVPPFIYFQF